MVGYRIGRISLPAHTKFEAVQEILKKKATVSEVARKTVYAWVKRYQNLASRKKAAR